MSSSDALYTARFELPDLIEIGVTNVLRCRPYRAGAVAVPTSGTVSVYDPSNTALVSAAAVTVSAGQATYSLSSATVASSTPGEGWRVEWALVMPDTLTHTFRNDAALVRRRLYPVITEADLYRVESSIDPNNAACIHSERSFADKIDEAFVQIENRLIERGNRPNLVLSPSSFREAHLFWTLWLIFDDFASRLNAAYEAKARHYEARTENAWARVRWVPDAYDTGRPDDGAAGRRTGAPTIWLTSRGS